MVLEFILRKYSLQLLMYLLIAFLCWIFFQLIGIIVLLTFVDFSISDLTQINLLEVLKDNPDGYFILFTLLITQSIGLFIAPSLIFARLIKDSNKPFLPLKTKNLGSFILPLPIFVVAGIVLVSFMGELNMKLNLPQFFHDMESQATETIKYLLSFNSSSQLITTTLLMAVVPAIGEELFFRGIIQKILAKWTKSNWQAILITAFIFSAIHFQFLTFLPRFFMGIMLGYLLVWSRSLWIPILAHFLHNFISVLVGIQTADNSLETTEAINPWLVIGSTIVILLIGYWYYTSYKKNYVPEN